MNFLEEVGAANPDIATVETYGQSTEGRALKVIRIGTWNSRNKQNSIFP
jgi:hypothetical protein